MVAPSGLQLPGHLMEPRSRLGWPRPSASAGPLADRASASCPLTDPLIRGRRRGASWSWCRRRSWRAGARSGPSSSRHRASRRRLVQGNLEIGARLDLHGMTAAQAERSLARFIDSASTAHHRCVLVITGKGRGGQGVLRRLVPKWLKTSPLSGRILAISNATQADGGEGALYVMLRRTRNL